MKLKILYTLFFCFQVTLAQYTNTDILAKIHIEAIDGSTNVIYKATNTTEINKSLRYLATVFKTDHNSNISKKIQEGRFTLEPNESKELFKSPITIQPDIKLVVLLLIYEEEEIVGKDRVAFNEEVIKEEKNSEVASNDGIELKGIVVEETKTKPGRDFYEFFFSLYSQNQINGNKVVEVLEKLSFGRSTIIQVKIEDVTIHEFIGKPDLEYLEQMSKVAIRKVYKYFKDQKKQKEDIFQY
ncbi:CsgE family curli-type amyloid fiber assembly protein [Aquimarina pacifica]|uniref:CsgE family curli-type amyloid fiber assembly protein n=1 Tax=Aquimarina pacifica TaxID=1296415 RepID=UPI0004719DA9|nr:CsgE family curli-type amyloid fiber assembly protein [Aquimarina pacifica]